MTDTALLAACLFGVLAVATTVSVVLSWRSERPSQTLVNLNQRIRAWWVMVAVLTAAFLAGTNAMVVLFALVSFAALREYVTVTQSRRSDHLVLFGMFGIVLPAQYVLIWQGWYGLYSIFIPVYCFLLMPALTALRGDTERFLARVSEQQWGLMLAVYCISHVPALATLPIAGYEGRNLFLIAYLIIVVQGCDVLQYIFGKLFGRHALSKVSPSKTWEGLVGGVACASLLGAALWWITPFTPIEAAALAALACLMGFLGGLVASAIKRDRGIKDWGHMIDGHGGIMDRADSLIFAAPVLFHVVRYFWT